MSEQTEKPFDPVFTALEERVKSGPNATTDMALIDSVEAFTGREHMNFATALAYAEGLRAGYAEGVVHVLDEISSAGQKAGEWRPMESAPKDFTYADIDWAKTLPNSPAKRIRMSAPVALLTPMTLRPDEKPEDQDYHLTKASWVAHDDKELWWDLDGEMPFELDPIGWMPIPCHDAPKTGEGR